MRIPRFWAAAEGSTDGPRGVRLFRRMWGWSMSSAAEALDLAEERLRSALATLTTGQRVGGYYPRQPLREPILAEEFADEPGDTQAVVVTRNRYGAEVLSTDRVLIADIDLPGLERPTRSGFLRRLFAQPSPAESPGEPPEVLARLRRLADWAAANPQFSVIVYRTASGLRVFVAGLAEPATSPRGAEILAELDADPIYRELCRAAGTFRARLTPKPWRLPGLAAPRDRWPLRDAAAEARFARWLARYEAASREYAVCRRLTAHGPAPSGWAAHVIALHDQRTRADTPLPLA